jgi:hypothetical protein
LLLIALAVLIGSMWRAPPSEARETNA